VPVLRPLPIAILLTSFEPGGTERQMIELIRRLPPSRWCVHVACLHLRGRWRHKVLDAAASVAEFPIASFRRADTYRQALAFARWCARHGIALVHTSDLYSNIFGLPSAALARVPVRIGNRRGLYLELSPSHLAMQRAAFSCAHAIVANSNAAALRLQAERIAADRVVLVPNGLDLERFAPAAPRPQRRRVVTVANLRAEKGHQVLIDAAASVLQHYPDARFTLVGDGPERQAIEQRLARAGLAGAFTLLGEREDIHTVLQDADIAVLPSLTESLPNALLEYMAAALPTVASNVGGVPDVIEHGRTGLLVPAGDAVAMAHEIGVLMADPMMGTRLGRNARAEVQRLYSFPRMVAAIEDLYTRELARRGVLRTGRAA
jgi:glycosyltransferase involved in cell wall biosynthesis